MSTSGRVVTTEARGTLDYVSEDAPGRVLETPSGICHYWDYPVYDYFYGDIEGPVTFQEKGNGPCDFTRFTGSGPYQARVALRWNGRTGVVSGQWTIACKPDATQPAGLSCDGTMNGRGSEGLEGVVVHLKWVSGWYPFQYTADVQEHVK